MKDFFKNYKKFVIGAIAVWSVLLVLFFVNVGFSISKVNTVGKKIISDSKNNPVEINWNSNEIRNLYKEKVWIEQQLALAKSDSFSMGINLKDSVVQVQLKGTVLFQGKILMQKPNQFFNNSGKEVYLNYFSKTSVVDSSKANVPKRPIRKVVAPQIGADVEPAKIDTVKSEEIHWEFITSNQIRVIINGVAEINDSVQTDIPVKKDIFSYRFKNEPENIFSNRFIPTLFLWLDDTDAKAIYRALPERPKCIFRN